MIPAQGRRSRRAVALGGAMLLGLAGSVVAPVATAAVSAVPSVVVAADEPTPAPVATSRSASASPSTARPGEQVIIRGAGWPAQEIVNASICGNNFLNGQGDCDPDSTGQGVADAEGNLIFDMLAAIPPKPCPCVVRISAFSDTNSVSAPIEIVGAPVADPVQDPVQIRVLDVSAKLDGGADLRSLFGLSAQRELVLNIRNPGNTPVLAAPINVGFGHGSDPTDPVLNPDGSSIVVPDLQPGATAEVRVPIEIEPIAAGTYRAKASFVGLDKLLINGQATPEGTLSVTTDTSTYPWGFILLIWLLLQIPLLGLYKRRPVVVTPAPAVAYEFSPDAFGLFEPAQALPDPSSPPPPPGYRTV
jgi:hypothetical protein